MAEATLGLVDLFLATLALAILSRALMSRVDPCGRSGASRVLYDLTEPIQAPIRQLVPPIGVWLDVSCWISLFVIRLLSPTRHQALPT